MGGPLVFDKYANLCGQFPKFQSSLQSFILNDDGTIEGEIIEPANYIPNIELEPTVFWKKA